MPANRATRRRLNVEALENRTVPAVFAVTTAADVGAGSLRQAILDANAAPGPDTIEFAIDTGVQTIRPASQLPTITQSVVIDGTTQPRGAAAAGTLLIELDGTDAGVSTVGLNITGPLVTVRGLAVNSFGNVGIFVQGAAAAGAQIEGNYVGLDPTGEVARPNLGSGIQIRSASDVRIVNNVVSANATGIVVGFGTAGRAVVTGNIVGMNAAGTVALPNSGGGVSLTNGGDGGHRLGGTTVAERNYIVGGVSLSGADNIVAGNYIGTNKAGDVRFGGFISVGLSSNLMIGGTTAARNVIVDGVDMLALSSVGTTIQGNYIGTDATGMTRLADSTGVGVGVNGPTSDTTVRGNVIAGSVLVRRNGGGVTAPNRNTVIVGNFIGVAADGTTSLDPSGTGVTIISTGGGVVTGARVGGPAAGDGNVISGFAAGTTTVGAVTIAAAGVTVEGNKIGTNAAGTAAIGNGGNGIAVSAADATVRNNLIAGNGGTGISVASFAATGLIAGNLIGTNVDGTAAIPNDIGIAIGDNGFATIGTDALIVSGNVISGNTRYGIQSRVTTGRPVFIRGNSIGTNAAGDHAVPNGLDGIFVQSASPTGIVIGGSNPDDGNVIGGNAWYGIRIGGGSGNRVLGNWIGVSKSGSPLPNGRDGVLVTDVSSDNVIGGVAPGEGNVIAFNTGRGVWVGTESGSSNLMRNAIRGNAIFYNGGLGIDIGNLGLNPIDPLDSDLGANGLQNRPELLSAQVGAVTTVQGTLQSTPNTTFWLDFYASAADDAEGGRYLGVASVTTDSAGIATFSVTLSAATVAGEVVTATATDPTGNTSEFSIALTPVYNSPPTSSAGGPYTVAEGGSVGLDGSASSDPDQPSGTLAYAWDFDNDGDFDDAIGANPTFSAAGLDGFAGAEVTVRLQVTDSDGATSVSSATVSITNADPVPSIDSISAPRIEGTAITVAGSVTDPAGSNDTLTLAWAVYKDGATTAFATSGDAPVFAFTPSDNGSYRIVLTATDEEGGTATAEQTITVANVVPQDLQITGPTAGTKGQPLAFGGAASDPAEANDPLTFVWSATTGGTTVANGNGGQFEFTPSAPGTYTVTLTVFDDDGGESTVTRTIEVARANPVASDIARTSAEDGVVTFTESDFTAALTELTGNPFTVTVLSLPNHGTLRLGTTVLTAGAVLSSPQLDTLTFTPDADWNGTTAFGWSAADTGLASNSAQVTLAVASVNDAPVAVADAYSVQQGNLLSGAVLANDSDAHAGAPGEDNTPLTAVLVSGPAHAQSFTLNPDGTFTYRPADTYQGADGFTYQTVDSLGAVSDPVTVTINVTSPPAYPVGVTIEDGNILVITGADTNDWVSLTAVGTSPTGSTGIKVQATLNNQWYDLTFARSFALVRIDVKGGNDAVQMASGLTLRADVRAGEGNNYVQTARGDDVVTAGDGNDDINTGAGNDVVNAGNGNNYVDVGDGDNVVTTGTQDDQIRAGIGYDRIIAGGGNDGISVGDGGSLVMAGDGNLWFQGGDGADVLVAGAGSHSIETFAGDDVITTGDGNTYVNAGAGNDVVKTGSGNDSIEAGDGDDLIDAGDGDNYVSGGSGRDVLIGGAGHDNLSGGPGNDLLIGGWAFDYLSGGDDDDILVDGTAALALADDSFLAVLADWDGSEASSTAVRGRLLVSYDPMSRDELNGNAGLDWFWTNDLLDQTDRESGERKN